MGGGGRKPERGAKITPDGNYNCLSWAPDGKILHVEGEDGRSDVWRMNADGRERQRLTSDGSQNDWPVMSPDRRAICFDSRRSGSRQIWRIDSDGCN